MSETRQQTPQQGKRPVLKLNYPPSHSGELGSRQPNAGPSRPTGPASVQPPEKEPEIKKPKGPAFTPPTKIKKAPPPPKKTPEQKAAEKKANIRNTLKADRRAQREAAKARKAKQQEGFVKMQALAPTLFEREAPKPLAIGVGAPLRAALGLSVRQMRGLLAWWTGRYAYQVALAAGGARYALDGTPEGEISAADQETAQARVRPVPDAVAAAMESEPGDLPDAVAAAWDAEKSNA